MMAAFGRPRQQQEGLGDPRGVNWKVEALFVLKSIHKYSAVSAWNNRHCSNRDVLSSLDGERHGRSGNGVLASGRLFYVLDTAAPYEF